MSPRAAWRLDRLGGEVFDYAGGKLDWLAHALPFEGEADLVSAHMTDVATCRPDEPVGEVAARVTGDGLCVVVDDDGLVVGTLGRKALAAGDSRRSEEAARLGPTTVRPSEDRHQLDHRMEAAEAHYVLVTDPAGHLLGVYRRPPG